MIILGPSSAPAVRCVIIVREADEGVLIVHGTWLLAIGIRIDIGISTGVDIDIGITIIGIGIVITTVGGTRASASSGLQTGSEGIDLLFKLGDPTVGLLLPLPSRLGDNTAPAGLGAALAGAVRVRLVRLALDLQATTSLASARTLRVVGVERRRALARHTRGVTAAIMNGGRCMGSMRCEDGRRYGWSSSSSTSNGWGNRC